MGNLFDCETNALDERHFPKDGSETSIVVAPQTRFSDSRLWELQRRFYSILGQAAWTEAVVPHLLSSNAYVARSYARFIVGLLRDLYAGGGAPGINVAEPVYIVEFGAGHGKLSFLIMEMLKEFADAIPTCATPSGYPFVMVVSDAYESNVAAMEEREALLHYARLGVLDFAVVDVTAPADAPIKLRRSGTVLAPGKVANPVIALASYVVDSLQQDVIRLEDGKPSIGLLGLSVRKEDAYESEEDAEGAEAEEVEGKPEPPDEQVPGLARESTVDEIAGLASKLQLQWSWESLLVSEGEHWERNAYVCAAV
jgi:hypothetical protein